MSVTRDAAWGDDGIDTTHLNSPTGHSPERIGWKHERREHDAQEGVQEGKHLVDSPRYVGSWRWPESLTEDSGDRDYYHPFFFLFSSVPHLLAAIGCEDESVQWGSWL